MKVIKLGETREVHLHTDRFSVWSQGLRLFSFNVSTLLNTADAEDRDTEVALLDGHDDTRFVWEAVSTLWKKKQYILKFNGGDFSYRVKVWGEGVPTEIEYFRGSRDSIGSRFAVAGYALAGCQSTDRERARRLIDTEPAVIEPMRAAPPPFVFPFWNDVNDEWVGIGLAAKAGEHHFRRFELHAPKQNWDENGLWFTVPLEGYPPVEDGWRSPTIWGGFGRDDLAVIRAWANWQYRVYGYARNVPGRQAPAWWRLPIFCGWGEQCRQNARLGKPVPTHDYATEENYRRYIKEFETLELPIGTVIIDDKWQTAYGLAEPDPARWPDLRAFADEQHLRDRRVLLWFKCWDCEGLPAEECIRIDGKPVFADPTNPAYLARLERQIHRLLSADEGCFNCDGFKLDFMDCSPEKAALEMHDPQYGLELMHTLFAAIYRFAKAAKPDALVNATAAHPYFADCVDMFRVHDTDANLRSSGSIAAYRAAFAEAVMPDVLVDTDGGKGYTRAETLAAYRRKFDAGVPVLYDFPPELTKADWAAVKSRMETYVADL